MNARSQPSLEGDVLTQVPLDLPVELTGETVTADAGGDVDPLFGHLPFEFEECFTVGSGALQCNAIGSGIGITVGLNETATLIDFVSFSMK